MTARVLPLWAILCAGVLWGMLNYSSADPTVFSFDDPSCQASAWQPSQCCAGPAPCLARPPVDGTLLFSPSQLCRPRFSAARTSSSAANLVGELGTFLLLGTAIFRLRGPDVRPILDGSFREGGKVILVNIGVLMCALIVSEGAGWRACRERV